MSLNSVSLMGRLTSDVELRHTQSGKSVVNFTLAINKFSSKDHPESSFIDCVAWSGTAELISKYFKKGTSLLFLADLKQEHTKTRMTQSVRLQK